MLDVETKTRINTARDILVGKVPDPKSQVEQITIALIYKFMDDMDVESEELGGKRTFFVGEYAKYAWRKIFDPKQSRFDLLNLYSEAIGKMDINPGVPKLFRDIFKNAYLPYRDPETLKSFLKIINEFEYTHSEKLGDAFEFLLSILGSQGDAGQFRTPRHIIDFMVEIIDPNKHEIILDPACGTAGFLISSYKHIVKQNSSNYLPDQNDVSTVTGTQSVNEVIITSNGYSGDKLTADERRILADNIHGYDISPDMVRLSLVNMYLHGIKEPHISEYDTLTSEDHWNQYCDVILANPPFMSPKGGIRPHKRFSVPSNRSEVLFVDYIAEHLTPDGRAAVIVPEGIIFQSGTAYKNLRKMLVEKYLVGVISLPAGVFQPYSGVKTSILWLDKVLAKKTDRILFVKIENDGFDLGAQRRAIKDNDIPTALKFISQYKTSLINNNSTADIEILNARVVAKEEIYEKKDYSLSGERYNHEVLKESIYPWVTLGSACTINPKKAEIKDKNQDMEVSFVPMSDLNENQASFEPKQEKKLLDVFNGYTYFQNNDVLLARVTPCFENGKAGLAKNLKNGIGFGSSEYIIFRASANVLPYWIYLAITSDTFRRIGKSKMTGTGGLQR
ncbi:MAG: N-6 DNA methylase, partial [Bacteroidia bacterium]|nr:N-6 DNA methylase [Bacteroidia bacterium]